MCNHGQINRQGRCKRKLCYEIAHILFFGGQTICYGSQSENPHSLVIVNNWLPALAYMDVIFHVCLFRGVWKTCSLWRENTLTGYFFVRCSNSGRWARKYGTITKLQVQTAKKKQGKNPTKLSWNTIFIVKNYALKRLYCRSAFIAVSITTWTPQLQQISWGENVTKF